MSNKIVAMLNELKLDTLNDEELSSIATVLRAKANEASRISYLRARQHSIHDPDVMAAE